jgi:hypothetical protein
MHFLTFDDGAVALAGLRRSRGLPGSEAVVRRGPVHRDDPANQTVARAVAVAEWARSQGEVAHQFTSSGPVGAPAR